jgi:hypothetical protein
MIYTHVLQLGARRCGVPSTPYEALPFRCIPVSPNVRNDRSATSTVTRRISPIATEHYDVLRGRPHLPQRKSIRERESVPGLAAIAHTPRVTMNKLRGVSPPEKSCIYSILSQASGLWLSCGRTDGMAKRSTMAKKSPTTTTPGPPAKDTCFTIMPFGGWFDDYYLSVFSPAIVAAGLEPCRADDLYRPSTIVHDIWAYTRSAKLILADLTGRNPNVFYELGLAHALAKPAILVAETIDDVPFDLRALRVIEYTKNAPNWGELLKNKIQSSIREILQSPLESVLPAFLSVRSAQTPTVTPHEKEILELKQELELLRREIRSGSVRTSRDIHGPDEADEAIMEYIARGFPKELLIRRLSDRGVPTTYTRKRIEELTSGVPAKKDQTTAEQPAGPGPEPAG